MNSVTAKWEEQDLEQVASAEGLSRDKLKRLIESGRVAIPRNARRAVHADGRVLKAIGEGMSTKVNVNV
ncbi:MAG: phosphomethylpyrimidine synthase ThiC, partial [Methanophagales archaeon]|nr:phosphomethylpyrimidine synthase ThiC [Methanophagales archaeon]